MNTSRITADTALPSRFGQQSHYPRVHSGIVVTMPGTDDMPLIFPTLCGNAYARRPKGETTQLSLCTRCAEIRAGQNMSAA